MNMIHERKRKKGSSKKLRALRNLTKHGKKTNVGDPNPSGNSVKHR